MKYDLHVHTHHSKCGILKPATILKLAKKKGFNGIAVTDHGTIQGGLDVKKLNTDKDFEVIVGAEVRTNKGELLLFYLNEEIKSKNLFEVIDEARQQGALISISHPYRAMPHLRFKYPIEKLLNKIDAIETFNSRMLPFDNYWAQKKAKKFNIAATGGSDAHFPFDIGKGYTIFEGSLEKALKTKQTKVGGSIALGWLSGTLGFFSKRVIRPLID